MSINSEEKRAKSKSTGNAKSAASEYQRLLNAGFSKDTITAHLHNIGYKSDDIYKGQKSLGIEAQGGEKFDWDSYIYDYGKKTTDNTRQSLASDYFYDYTNRNNQLLDDYFKQRYGTSINTGEIPSLEPVQPSKPSASLSEAKAIRDEEKESGDTYTLKGDNWFEKAMLAMSGNAFTEDPEQINSLASQMSGVNEIKPIRQAGKDLAGASENLANVATRNWGSAQAVANYEASAQSYNEAKKKYDELKRLTEFDETGELSEELSKARKAYETAKEARKEAAKSANIKIGDRIKLEVAGISDSVAGSIGYFAASSASVLKDYVDTDSDVSATDIADREAIAMANLIADTDNIQTDENGMPIFPSDYKEHLEDFEKVEKEKLELTHETPINAEVSEKLLDASQQYFSEAQMGATSGARRFMNTVNSVAPSVIFEAAAMAATIATGGAGAAAAHSTAVKLISLSLMGMSAAGSETREAIEKGMNKREALSLGIVSGATEIATELMGFDDLMELATTPWGKNFVQGYVSSMLSEGAEEVASQFIGDVTKGTIYGYSVEDLYGEGATFADIIQGYIDSFVGGAAGGGLLGGVSLATNTAINGAKRVGGKIADVASPVVNNISNKAKSMFNNRTTETAEIPSLESESPVANAPVENQTEVRQPSQKGIEIASKFDESELSIIERKASQGFDSFKNDPVINDLLREKGYSGTAAKTALFDTVSATTDVSSETVDTMSNETVEEMPEEASENALDALEGYSEETDTAKEEKAPTEEFYPEPDRSKYTEEQNEVHDYLVDKAKSNKDYKSFVRQYGKDLKSLGYTTDAQMKKFWYDNHGSINTNGVQTTESEEDVGPATKAVRAKKAKAEAQAQAEAVATTEPSVSETEATEEVDIKTDDRVFKSEYQAKSAFNKAKHVLNNEGFSFNNVSTKPNGDVIRDVYVGNKKKVAHLLYKSGSNNIIVTAYSTDGKTVNKKFSNIDDAYKFISDTYGEMATREAETAKARGEKIKNRKPGRDRMTEEEKAAARAIPQVESVGEESSPTVDTEEASVPSVEEDTSNSLVIDGVNYGEYMPYGDSKDLSVAEGPAGYYFIKNTNEHAAGYTLFDSNDNVPIDGKFATEEDAVKYLKDNGLLESENAVTTEDVGDVDEDVEEIPEVEATEESANKSDTEQTKESKKAEAKRIAKEAREKLLKSHISVRSGIIYAEKAGSNSVAFKSKTGKTVGKIRFSNGKFEVSEGKGKYTLSFNTLEEAENALSNIKKSFDDEIPSLESTQESAKAEETKEVPELENPNKKANEEKAKAYNTAKATLIDTKLKTEYGELSAEYTNQKGNAIAFKDTEGYIAGKIRLNDDGTYSVAVGKGTYEGKYESSDIASEELSKKSAESYADHINENKNKEIISKFEEKYKDDWNKRGEKSVNVKLEGNAWFKAVPDRESNNGTYSISISWGDKSNTPTGLNIVVEDGKVILENLNNDSIIGSYDGIGKALKEAKDYLNERLRRNKQESAQKSDIFRRRDSESDATLRENEGRSNDSSFRDSRGYREVVQNEEIDGEIRNSDYSYYENEFSSALKGVDLKKNTARNAIDEKAYELGLEIHEDGDNAIYYKPMSDAKSSLVNPIIEAIKEHTGVDVVAFDTYVSVGRTSDAPLSEKCGGLYSGGDNVYLNVEDAVLSDSRNVAENSIHEIQHRSDNGKEMPNTPLGKAFKKLSEFNSPDGARKPKSGYKGQAGEMASRILSYDKMKQYSRQFFNEFNAFCSGYISTLSEEAADVFAHDVSCEKYGEGTEKQIEYYNALMNLEKESRGLCETINSICEDFDDYESLSNERQERIREYEYNLENEPLPFDDFNEEDALEDAFGDEKFDFSQFELKSTTDAIDKVDKALRGKKIDLEDAKELKSQISDAIQNGIKEGWATPQDIDILNENANDIAKISKQVGMLMEKKAEYNRKLKKEDTTRRNAIVNDIADFANRALKGTMFKHVSNDVKAVFSSMFDTDNGFLDSVGIDENGEYYKKTFKNREGAKKAVDSLYKYADKNAVIHDDALNNIADRIKSIIYDEAGRPRRLDDLSHDELISLEQSLKGLRKGVNNIARLKAFEKGTEINTLRNNLSYEADDAKKKNKLSSAITSYGYNDVFSAIDELGGFNPLSTARKISNDLRARNKARYELKMKWGKLINTVTSDRASFNKFQSTADGDMVHLKNGVKMSHDTACYFVMLCEDEQTGIVEGKRPLDIVDPKKAYNMSGFADWQSNMSLFNAGEIDVNTYNEVKSQLTDFDKKMIDACREVLKDARKVINKYSLENLYMEIAQNENYCPERTRADYNVKTGASSLFNRSQFQKRTLDTDIPLIVSPLSSVMNSYINTTADVVNFAPFISDLNKVLGDKNAPLAREFRRKLGDRTVNNIENLLKPVVGQGATHDDLFGRFNANLKKSAITASFSIAAGQFASYPAASSILSVKSIAKNASNMAMRMSEMQKVWDRMDKVTPFGYMRRGGFGYTQLTESGSKIYKKFGSTGEFLNSLTTRADVRTTTALYLACETEAEDVYGLKPNSKEFNAKVAELYERVLEETQPMFDSIYRNELYNKGSLSRATQNFTTLPARQANTLYKKAQEMRYAISAYNEYDSKANLKAKNDAIKSFAKTTASIATTTIVFSAIRTAVNALLRKYKDKDDAKDDFINRIISSVGNNIMPGLGSFFESSINKMLGKNVSVWGSTLSRDMGYDVIEECTKGIINLIPSIMGDEDYDQGEIYKFGKIIAKMYGIPYSNIQSQIKSVNTYVTDAIRTQNSYYLLDNIPLLDNDFGRAVAKDFGFVAETATIPSLLDDYVDGVSPDKAVEYVYRDALNKKGELQKSKVYDQLYEYYGTDSYNDAYEFAIDVLEKGESEKAKNKQKEISQSDVEAEMYKRIKDDLEEYSEASGKEKKELEQKLIPFLGDDIDSYTSLVEANDKQFKTYTQMFADTMSSSDYYDLVEYMDRMSETYSGKGKSDKLYKSLVSKLAEMGVSKKISRQQLVALCKSFGIAEGSYERKYK